MTEVTVTNVRVYRLSDGQQLVARNVGLEAGRIDQAVDCGGDDVDACLQQAHVVGHGCGIPLGSVGRVHDAVGPQRDQLVGVVGGRHADGADADDVPGVGARLVGGVQPYTAEVGVCVLVDCAHR